MGGNESKEFDEIDVSMFRDDFHEDIHRKHGVCGHCGEKDCKNKKTWSKLPDSLPTSSVLESFRRMMELHFGTEGYCR
ncbi:MAG: hypothetical protein PF495_13935 [Spirochaetales bacterium]|jgi:hypothetical protein|nr:hypothetical protein [Spirochaetales bacterium]